MSFDNFDSFDWNAMQNNAVEKQKKSFEKDTRYWTISSNEQGVGSALIRLLPDPKNVPYVQRFEYALRKPVPGGKPKWYIANSRETINEKDPAKEHYDRLKAEGSIEADKIAKEQFSRATKYICNIMVINDPVNPANNGKIFLFKMGTKLKGKIDGWMNPDANEISCGTEPKQFYNPLGEGRDILLKVKPQGNIPNYDDTEYKDKRALFTDKESAVNYIVANCYDLQENVLSPKEFDSYEDLKKRFDSFVNANVTQAVPVTPAAVVPAYAQTEGFYQPAQVVPVAQPQAIGVQYTQPVVQPAVAQVVQPQMVQPIVQPIVQPVVQPTTQPAVQVATPYAAQSAQPQMVQPESIVQPMTQPVVQPMAQSAVNDDWMSEIE